MKTKSTGLHHRLQAYCFLLLCVFCFQYSFAQQGTVSAGGNASGSSGSVSYSIGQVSYTSSFSTAGNVSEGVQQVFNFVDLPVTLVSFEAFPVKIENNLKVLISWETTSEINNDFFTIERSIDGKTFAELGRVNAHEGSIRLKKYSWTDPVPFPGVSYYRLKQTDLDHTYAYSRMKVVRIDNTIQILAYPNPVNSYLHVSTAKNTIHSYKIFDLSGKLVQEGQFSDAENKVNMGRLSPAAYIIQIVGRSEIEQFKIIKN